MKVTLYQLIVSGERLGDFVTMTGASLHALTVAPSSEWCIETEEVEHTPEPEPCPGCGGLGAMGDVACPECGGAGSY